MQRQTHNFRINSISREINDFVCAFTVVLLCFLVDRFEFLLLLLLLTMLFVHFLGEKSIDALHLQ